MDYLDFLDEHFKKPDEAADEQTNDQPSLEMPIQNLPLQPNNPKIDCKHDQVQGNPKNGGICLDCHEVLTSQQMSSYR